MTAPRPGPTSPSGRTATSRSPRSSGRRGGRELGDVAKGFRGAAHGLALGKIYLAELPEESWPSYLQRPVLKRFSRHTLTDRNQLRHNLLAVRERGLAFE